jgi:peptidoglycan/LPS O-acetylase OafA/YrhL
MVAARHEPSVTAARIQMPSDNPATVLPEERLIPRDRNSQLDFLRALAILLVLGRHFAPRGLWSRSGWIGVDLFFVLSGFLVSGLLFQEHRLCRGIDVKRFLIRRGFKIYPSFWLLLVATALLSLGSNEARRPLAWLSEVLFLQNYGPALWGHTWSLAVEEHFYLLVALVLFFLGRAKRDDPDPFASVPRWGLGVLALVLAFRVLTVALLPVRYKMNTLGTHLRIDGLLFGTLLAYYYYYHGQAMQRFVSSYALPLLFASALGVAPALFLDWMHPFIRSLGFTLLYLAFGGFMAVLLLERRCAAAFRNVRWLAALSSLGVYSYNIYLWHTPFARWVTEPMIKYTVCPITPEALFLLNVVQSILVGGLMTWLVELPTLALRNRLFPRSFSAEATQAHTEVRSVTRAEFDDVAPEASA